MRKLILLTLILALTALTVPAAGDDTPPDTDASAAVDGYAQETDEETNGWIMTESSEMTEDAMAAFDRAVQDLTDAVYEPVALLGEQQGVCCILCRVRGEDEGVEPYYTLLYAGENGVQNVWDLWIEYHDTPDTEDEDEKEDEPVNISKLLFDLASLREADDRVAEDLDALKDSELASFVADKWQAIYMNPDFRLFIHGKDNPADLPVSGKHAFVILGFELDNGEMSDELKARCGAAAAAAAAFPGSALICSGGATGENNPEGHTEAGLMKDYLIRTCGIDADRILIDESALTTLENAVNTFAILKEQGIETITIVTSSYHQRRAQLLYETLAEMIRRKEGVSVTVAGNYSCEVQQPEILAQIDAKIAAMQLAELIAVMDDSAQ